MLVFCIFGNILRSWIFRFELWRNIGVGYRFGEYYIRVILRIVREKEMGWVDIVEKG